jgi:hypothetical protein
VALESEASGIRIGVSEQETGQAAFSSLVGGFAALAESSFSFEAGSPSNKALLKYIVYKSDGIDMLKIREIL